MTLALKRAALAVGFLGLVPAGLDALPQPAQDALGFLGSVEVVQPPLQRRPVLLAALGSHRGQRLLQARAGVGADIVQPGEGRQRLLPGGRRTIRAALAQQQGHAGWLHADQARLAAEEDLIQGHRLGTRAGHGVQGGEHVTGLMLGVPHPVADGGAVGARPLGKSRAKVSSIWLRLSPMACRVTATRRCWSRPNSTRSSCRRCW